MIRVFPNYTQRTMSTTMDEHTGQSQTPAFEQTDAQVKPLFITGIVVLVLMVASFIGIIPLFKILDYYQPLLDDPVAPMAQERVGTLSEPRLQVDPPRQKFELAASAEALLSSYAWADQELRLARIPIDRAITLVGSGTLSLPKAPVGQ